MAVDRYEEGGRVVLELAGAGDAAVLQEVFEGAADYFERLTGRATVDADAAGQELRAAKTSEGREVALLRTGEGGEPVGALGWWSGSPEPDVALLGMVLIMESHRGRGYAREGVQNLEARVRAEGIHRLRTAVGARDLSSHRFLEALGFTSMDQRAHVDMDGGRLRIAFYEKAL